MQRDPDLYWVREVLAKKGLLLQAELVENSTWKGAVIDSRADCRGRLFFALPGQKSDGHLYLDQAAAAGARALVISKERAGREARAKSCSYFLVEDTLAALQELARAYRKELRVKVVAVTGSNGKTTTKEMIRTLLSVRYRVHANPGNYNNHIGVPLTLLESSAELDYLVCELGANHEGEIAFLAGLIAPRAGVVTNIGEAHIGYFGSKANIARAKAELIGSLPAHGYAVLPGDSPFFSILRKNCRARVLSFGFSSRCRYRLHDVHSGPGGLSFRLEGVPFELRLAGPFNALNAAAALAAADQEGIAIEDGVSVLAHIDPFPGRGRVLAGGGVEVLDDSYNANPSSMEAALAVLRSRKAGRRIAVLGEMKELGRFSTLYHRKLGKLIDASGLDMVFWVGGYAEAVRDGLGPAGARSGFFNEGGVDELAGRLTKILAPGDVVLIKGSHACGLDRLVDRLIESLGLKKGCE